MFFSSKLFIEYKTPSENKFIKEGSTFNGWSGSNNIDYANLHTQSEEDLIAENQRLRMEIEYLKKLSALVLAEERKNGKRR